MPVNLTCQCGTRFSVADKRIGLPFNCNTCGQQLCAQASQPDLPPPSSPAGPPAASRIEHNPLSGAANRVSGLARSVPSNPRPDSDPGIERKRGPRWLTFWRLLIILLLGGLSLDMFVEAVILTHLVINDPSSRHISTTLSRQDVEKIAFPFVCGSISVIALRMFVGRWKRQALNVWIAAKRTATATVSNPDMGSVSLVWNDKQDWWLGSIELAPRHSIDLQVDAGKNEADLRAVIEAAGPTFVRLRATERAVREAVVGQMVGIHNDLCDPEDKLAVEQFADGLLLQSVVFEQAGTLELTYSDGGLFGGRCIIVPIAADGSVGRAAEGRSSE
jgi:hypothetical protein